MAIKSPFVMKGKKYYLWDFMKIDEIADAVYEATFWNYLSLKNKCLAFLLLEIIAIKYKINVVGLGISINVVEDLRHDFGDTWVEKIVFPYPATPLDFSPDRNVAEIDLPGELCAKIDLLERGEVRQYSADYFTVKMKTSKVYSLLLA